MPKTRDECEIAGYRDVLHMIHESYEHIPVKSAFILQLHRSLYKFEDIGTFHPVAAWETSESVERLCAAYENAVNRTNADHLLLIPMFILDFLCIHPFQNGNGRMSRLLTLLLLYKSGYYVGKYISIERLTNPLDVIEQMTYLMFIHDLDDADNTHIKESAVLGLPFESIFAREVTIGDRVIDGAQLKWSVFHDLPADRIMELDAQIAKELGELKAML